LLQVEDILCAWTWDCASASFLPVEQLQAVEDDAAAKEAAVVGSDVATPTTTPLSPAAPGAAATQLVCTSQWLQHSIHPAAATDVVHVLPAAAAQQQHHNLVVHLVAVIPEDAILHGWSPHGAAGQAGGTQPAGSSSSSQQPQVFSILARSPGSYHPVEVVVAHNCSAPATLGDAQASAAQHGQVRVVKVSACCLCALQVALLCQGLLPCMNLECIICSCVS
jgi:hypothetical protein